MQAPELTAEPQQALQAPAPAAVPQVIVQTPAQQAPQKSSSGPLVSTLSGILQREVKKEKATKRA